MVFDFRLGRGRDGPKQFLGQFEGLLQTDGYAAVRHEVQPMIVRYEKSISRTCGSVRSSLSAPARLVTVGSEAAKTTRLAFGLGDIREEVSATTSVKVVGALGWMTCPTYVNRSHASLNRTSQRR